MFTNKEKAEGKIMDKIAEIHLERAAFIYVRQSTLQQVYHHKESQRLQYGLVNRAKTLGWQTVEVIDDDLGVSGSGREKRLGFEKLLSSLCQGKVGAIFAMDASRLARNGREWHTLLEFCALVKTLLIDLDSIYDPTNSNDRLLLGMKGTLSEMELSMFRQRSQEAMRQKAARGELYGIIAIGYSLNGKFLEKDANQRIKKSIDLVFTKFKEFLSARQVLLWFRQENITMPVVKYKNGERTVVWRLPIYDTIISILKNPIYAGCYTYGRTVTETTFENGQKKITKGKAVDQKHWQVLIKEHHEGYISWKEFESIQQQLTDNANMKGVMTRGSVKQGSALLGGLLRCGHCGRKISVNYNGRAVRYQCKSAPQNHEASKCITFGNIRVDEKISELLLEVVSPLGVEAALKAAQELEQNQDNLLEHYTLALQQARYEAERFERQFEVVEPENRLVAAELEKRWEKSLTKVSEWEQKISSMSIKQSQFTEKDKTLLLELGTRLRELWYSKKTSFKFKKHIIRTLIEEIIANIEDNKVKLIIHWQGGVHTMLETIKCKTGEHRYKTEAEAALLIEKSSRYMSDKNIASLLNRLGKKSAKGYAWNESYVRSFRNEHKIAVYKKDEHHQRGELTIIEVSEKLKISQQTIMRLIKRQILPAKQVCKGAPWIVEEKAVNIFIEQYGKAAKTKALMSSNPNQLSFNFCNSHVA